MSTLVQIKRSYANTTPASLLEGELAYSFLSNTLFIGDTANVALNIGGKYYMDMLDARSASNIADTLVIRTSNGSTQFSQLDILIGPTANSHVATKQYVDEAIQGNVSLASLNDVDIGTAFSNQDAKLLIGNAAGYYVGTTLTGNASITNTGILTIGSEQVQNWMLSRSNVTIATGDGLIGGNTVSLGNSITLAIGTGNVQNWMLANSDVTILAGEGLIGGGTVSLGNTIQLDVRTGDGMANTGDYINVDNTVVRTDRNQTLNGVMTFSNTTTFLNGIQVIGNVSISGNATQINVESLNVADPIIFLASNNIISDIVDIGIVGSKNTSGVFDHTGLIRHAADGIWYLFDNLLDKDHQNNIVNVANTTYALLRANLDAKSIDTQILNVSQTLYVSGNTDLGSNLSVSSNLSVGGNVSVSGNLTVNGAASFGSLLLGAPLPTGSGGTGLTTFVANGVFFANDSTTMSFATGTEGQILQISSGVPTFAMVDGGSF
jgi:hypothetical protein